MPTANEKSRGYYKIKGAASVFNFDFRGKTVLDIGSSTGGFTQYALDHGAKKVIAVEKGTNQMKFPLRNDPRIELHEKTDIFDVVKSKEYVSQQSAGASSHIRNKNPRRANICDNGSKLASEPCNDRRERSGSRVQVFVANSLDVILADVSFVSLKKVLLHAKNHLAGNHTEFLVMLKPQFEAKPNELRNGIVKNEKLRREIIKNFERWLKQNHFLTINKRDNSLKGKTGNRERFYYLKLAK